MENVITNCPCGFNKDHEYVDVHCQYSAVGWLLFAIGISAYPIRVQYRCLKCGTVFDTITDPQKLKEYIGK